MREWRILSYFHAPRFLHNRPFHSYLYNAKK